VADQFERRIDRRRLRFAGDHARSGIASLGILSRWAVTTPDRVVDGRGST
jgi:hypothetical protein